MVYADVGLLFQNALHAYIQGPLDKKGAALEELKVLAKNWAAADQSHFHAALDSAISTPELDAVSVSNLTCIRGLIFSTETFMRRWRAAGTAATSDEEPQAKKARVVEDPKLSAKKSRVFIYGPDMPRVLNMHLESFLVNKSSTEDGKFAREQLDHIFSTWSYDGFEALSILTRFIGKLSSDVATMPSSMKATKEDAALRLKIMREWRAKVGSEAEVEESSSGVQ